MTALMLAATHRCESTLRLLLQESSCSHLSLVNKNDETVLHCLARSGNDSIVEVWWAWGEKSTHFMEEFPGRVSFTALELMWHAVLVTFHYVMLLVSAIVFLWTVLVVGQVALSLCGQWFNGDAFSYLCHLGKCVPAAAWLTFTHRSSFNRAVVTLYILLHCVQVDSLPAIFLCATFDRSLLHELWSFKNQKSLICPVGLTRGPVMKVQVLYISQLARATWQSSSNWWAPA